MHPYKSGHLKVGKMADGTPIQVYYELSGNPAGVPVVYLHGGPGDQINSAVRAFYNPKAYHVILFDQRGCGRSVPRNQVEKNTTKDILSDMEAVRAAAGAEAMVVTGGSWGTALAILYAEKYPSRVLGLILRGVYDLDLSDPVIPNLYPEQEEKLNKLVPAKTNAGFYKGVTRVLGGPRTAKRRKVVDLLTTNAPLYVMSAKTPRDTYRDKETLAIVGNHYESHHFFNSQKSLYKNLKKLAHIPVIMVEGRYDIVTPMYIAHKMCKLLAKCDLRVVKAGHAAMEPETKKALIRASSDMLALILK